MVDEILIKQSQINIVSVVTNNSSSVVAFSPSDLSGLIAWHKSDVGITIGTGVATWADQSGNGNDFGQATLGSQPAYNATDAQYNNKPSISFDGLADSLKITNLAYGPMTIISVCKVTTYPGANGYWYAHGGLEYLYSTTSFSMYTDGRSGAASAKDYAANWLVTTTPNIYVRRFDGTSAGDTLRISRSDISLSTQLAGNPGTDIVTSDFTLYAYAGGAGTSPGTIAENIIYNRSLLTAEVQQVEAYILSRYNI